MGRHDVACYGVRVEPVKSKRGIDLMLGCKFVTDSLL
jgi:hypothetical protein